MRGLILMGCVAVVAMAASPARAQRVVSVRAPANMQAALAPIAAEFEKFKKGTDVRIGTVGGVRIAANSQGGRVFIQDRIVVIARADDERLAKFAHIGLNLTIAVPKKETLEGGHVSRTLTTAGASYGKDWSANLRRNTKVVAASGVEAVRLVSTGKADAAVVNQSAADAFGKSVKAIAVPLELSEPIYYSATGRTSLDQAFVEFLFTQGNQMRLESLGFTSPLRAPQELVVQRENSALRLFTAALPTLKQETLQVKDEAGKSLEAKGASLRSLLKRDSGYVTFVGADGRRARVSISHIKRSGGVLFPMGGGNYRVILPGRPHADWIRWIRRIEVG